MPPYLRTGVRCAIVNDHFMDFSKPPEIFWSLQNLRATQNRRTLMRVRLCIFTPCAKQSTIQHHHRPLWLTSGSASRCESPTTNTRFLWTTLTLARCLRFSVTFCFFSFCFCFFSFFILWISSCDKGLYTAGSSGYGYVKKKNKERNFFFFYICCSKQEKKNMQRTM